MYRNRFIVVIIFLLFSSGLAEQWQFNRVVINGYSTSTNNGSADVNLPGFKNPYAVGVDPDGRVWAGSYYSRRLENTDGLSDLERYPDLWYEINGNDTTEIWNRPIWIWDPYSGSIDTIRFLDFGDGSQDTLTEGHRGIERSYDGNMIVMDREAVYKIDYQTYAVMAKWESPEEAQPLQGLAVDASGFIYALSLWGGEMYILDPDDLTLYYSFPTVVPSISRGHAVTPNGSNIYIGMYGDDRGVLHYYSADGPDGTFTFIDTVAKEATAHGTVLLDPTSDLWIIGCEGQDEKMWAFDPQDKFNIVDSTSFRFASEGDTTIYGVIAPEYVRCVREGAFSLDGNKMYLADFYSYSIKEYRRDSGIKVTFRANTCAVPDTLSENSTVQIRGNLDIMGGWTTSSQVFLNNMGGDYWECTVNVDSAIAADQVIHYKYCTSPSSLAHLPNEWHGWEAGDDWSLDLTAFTGSDTTLDLAYVRGWSDVAPGVMPFNATNTESIYVYLRVNMQSAIENGVFDSGNDLLGVRGTIGETMDWSNTVELLPESSHINGIYGSEYDGSNFYSGLVLVPESHFGTQEYKFVYHDQSNSGEVMWETVDNREITLPSEGDTTIHWVWWNNIPPRDRTKFYVSNWGDDASGDGSYSNPFATIQHAIDAASNYDTVIVMDGTYYENLTINSKNIILGSQFLENYDHQHRDQTIIDGSQTGAVIEISNVFDDWIHLEGLTITNGLSYTGGGINATNSRLRINECYLHSNVADTLGGGIYAYRCPEVEISMCNIQSNTSWGSSGGVHIQESNANVYASHIGNNDAPNGWAGAFQAYNPDQDANYHIYISDSQIENNTSEVNAGIDIWSSDDNSGIEAYITNCQISNNQSNRKTAVNIWGQNSYVHLTNVEIFDNYADTYIAGIHFGGNSSGVVERCLIWHNNAFDIDGGGLGTGVAVFGGAQVDIVNSTILANQGTMGAGLTNGGGGDMNIINTIIWGNTPSQIYLDQYNGVWGTTTFSHSLFDGDTEIVSSNLNQYYTDGGGNIFDDPQFTQPNGDSYELSATSPCIDSGHPDLDGDGTSWENDPDDQDPDGSRLDMGAYYFHHETRDYDDPVWQSHYGNDSDLGMAVTTSRDGGFVVAGISTANSSNGYNGCLVKFDENGNVAWDMFYGGDSSDYIYDVQQASNGDFLLCGFSNSFGTQGFDVWVVRIDSAGNELWMQTYGGDGDDRGYSIHENFDGGLIIQGITHSLNNGSSDYWLLRTDQYGNLVWDQTYGGDNEEICHSSIITSDGGYLLAGSSNSWSENGDSDLYLVKTDAGGDVDWVNTYGDEQSQQYFRVTETSSGDYIVASWVYNDWDQQYDCWVIKVDANGNEIWSNQYGGPANDRSFGIIEDIDGNYVIGGYSLSRDLIEYDAWLFKIDPYGGHIWEKYYGGSGYDAARDICLAENGDYIMGGFTNSIGDGSWDFYLLRAPGDITVDDNIYVATNGNDYTGDGSYDNPFATIQQAIDVSGHGDRIQVRLGTYYENINYLGKNIIISSDYYTTGDKSIIEQTILNGNQNGSVVTITSGEQYAVLRGLTVMSGNTDYGGGLNIQNSTVELRDLIVRDNHVSNYGGGIYMNSVNAQITNVVLFDNSADYGGGFWVLYSDLAVSNCSIVKNTANSNAWGFGVTGSSATMTNSLVWNPGYEEIYLSTISTGTFTAEYSNIRGGSNYIIVNNNQLNLLDGIIDEDPIFTSDYYLGFDSPCIDAGHPDLDGDGATWENDPDDQDPDGSRMDIGAYYYSQSTTHESTVADIYPNTGNFILPRNEIILEFSQPVDIGNLGVYCTLSSEHYGDFPYFLDIESSRRAVIRPENTYPFNDVVRINIVDGLQDSTGSSVDVSAVQNVELYTGLPADYNFDGMVNYQDFTTFGDLWYSSDESHIRANDLCPRTGNLPNIIVESDGQFGYDELMTLVYMWNWTHAQPEPIAKQQNSFIGNEPELVVNGRTITCPILTEAVAGQVIIEYDPTLTVVTASSGTNDQLLSLVKQNEDGGQLINEFGELGEIDLEQLIFSHAARTRNNYQIGINYTFIDRDNLIISQGRQEIDVIAVPEQFALYQNYPNPFNPVTTINYDLPEDAMVELSVYDITGRQVVVLVSERQEAGFKSIKWNGRNDHGNLVSAGMYLYVIKAGKHTAARKMVLLK